MSSGLRSELLGIAIVKGQREEGGHKETEKCLIQVEGNPREYGITENMGIKIFQKD
jgi:hypothetical protein